MTPDTLTCPRCGAEYTPRPTIVPSAPVTKFCATCLVRNLLDNLDLPTPPQIIDAHSKHPTLTDEEYKRKLSKS